MWNHPEQKKKPSLSFIIPITLTFSIAINEKISEKFKEIVANKGDDVSHVLRDFAFEILNIKNKDELNNLLYISVKNLKTEFYNKSNVTRKTSYNDLMAQKINEYIKQNEK